jgi:tetratricopeptide (TPR) repeat protein
MLGRQRYLHMDERFFQPSEHGAAGLVFYLLGDYSRAAKAYRAHFAAEIRDSGAIEDVTLESLLVGDHATATAMARARLGRDPGDVDALLTLGEVAYETGAFDEALRLFAEALEKQPEQFDALLLSSLASARAGDSAKAIESFNRALRYNRVESRLTTFLAFMEGTGELAKLRGPRAPLCVLAHYYRYFRIYDRSNANLVIAYAKKAIAAGDHPADAYLTMGITYEREGSREKALTALLSAIQIDPTHAYDHRWAAAVYSARGDLANEYRMRKAAAELAPGDPFYALELVEFLEKRMADHLQALAVVRKILDAAPNNVEALAWAGSLHSSIGEYAQSIELYQRALSLSPRDPFLHDNLGYSLNEIGRVEEAIASFQTAVALDPEYRHAHLMLAHLYRGQRRIQETVTEYETAFRIRRPDAPELAELCTVYHLSSEYQRAAECFRQVLSVDPGNRIARNLLPYTLRNLQGKETP